MRTSYSIGIDLQRVDQVRDCIDRHGPRYLERIYTPRELAESGQRPERLAARFAAKEATLKALARDRAESVPWQTIAVHHDADGRPSMELTGGAASLARRRGVTALTVSLTHERDHAGAVVLAERRS